MEKRENKGMMDNRKVHSTRQRGIERVIQKEADKECGKSGKMMAHGEAHWTRGGKLTPREA